MFRNKINHPRERQQPTNQHVKQKAPVRRITKGPSNHTVSLHYTLSTSVTSLTESSLGRGGFTLKTNRASPSSMSREKRVRMRPRGVVSKKCMGLRRSRRNSLSWSVEAAFTVHCEHNTTQHNRLNTRPDTFKQTTFRNTEGNHHGSDEETVGGKYSMCSASNTKTHSG